MPGQLKIDRSVGHKTANVSLVAFYGNKPPQLLALIQQLQDFLIHSNKIREFVPYETEQVHGTIIGCEGFKTESGIVSKWFDRCKQTNKAIDFAGLVNYFRDEIDLPLIIRFGGYDRQVDYNFLSRGQHPYFRSFQLQPTVDWVIPVTMGWSWDDGVSQAIANLRCDLQQFNLLHKYHARTDILDNDFYLRLGTIYGEMTALERKAIAIKIRSFLEERSPIYVPLQLDNLAMVRYHDLSLAPATTKIIPLSAITVSKLEHLYYQ